MYLGNTGAWTLMAALLSEPRIADHPERRPQAGEGIQPWYNHTGLFHGGEHEWMPTAVWAGPTNPEEGRSRAQEKVLHLPLLRALNSKHR